ncbi:MAG: hypothetical protein JW759_06735, partial [Candidatus Coatesbacteria bacterium]|nr:hypothetical protein [Candidatus Coatesbacteria bacterium]
MSRRDGLLGIELSFSCGGTACCALDDCTKDGASAAPTRGRDVVGRTPRRSAGTGLDAEHSTAPPHAFKVDIIRFLGLDNRKATRHCHLRNWQRIPSLGQWMVAAEVCLHEGYGELVAI